jgi:anti-sigma factor (TIGR02949 family)
MTDIGQTDRTECDEIVARLWPYLDNALSESERPRVVRHLQECVDCRSHYDFAKAFLDAVHCARPAAKSDDALRRRVLSALESEGFRRREPPNN